MKHALSKPALFDTNILIDYLNGIPEAHKAITQFSDRAISIITWMEVLAGATQHDESRIRIFLKQFKRIELDETIASEAVTVRRTLKIKLPDAIIYASARLHSRVLITRNARDLPATTPGVKIPYTL
jgi:predicted nucleic acid-binding protein